MTTWMLPAAARNIWLENCRSAMESLVMKRKDRCGISAISADLHGCTSGCRAPPEADARQRVKIHPQGENHAVLRRYCLDYRHCCRRPGLFRRCRRCSHHCENPVFRISGFVCSGACFMASHSLIGVHQQTDKESLNKNESYDYLHDFLCCC